MDTGVCQKRPSRLRAKFKFGYNILVMTIPGRIDYKQFTYRIDTRLANLTTLSIQSGALGLHYWDSDGDDVWVDGDESLEEAFCNQLQQALTHVDVQVSCTTVYFVVKPIAENPIELYQLHNPATQPSGSRSATESFQGRRLEFGNQYVKPQVFSGHSADNMDIDQEGLHPSLPVTIQCEPVNSDVFGIALQSPSLDHVQTSQNWYDMKKWQDPRTVLNANTCDANGLRVEGNEALMDDDLGPDWDQWLAQFPPSGHSGHQLEQGPCKTKHPRFSPAQKHDLVMWYGAHNDYPYPTRTELGDLSLQTGLDTRRIKNWFSRTRQKDFAQLQNSDPSPMSRRLEETLQLNPSSNIGHTLSISDSQLLLSEMGRMSLEVFAASSKADSAHGADLTTVSLNEEVEQYGSYHNSSICQGDKRLLAGREDDKLQWWLEQIPIKPPDVIRMLYNDTQAPIDDEATVLNPESNGLRFASPQFPLIGSPSSQVLENLQSLPAENNDSTPSGRGRRFTNFRRVRKRAQKSARSEASSDGRSAHSGKSVGSNMTEYSACSYTSYGSRRGRRRPRRVVVGNEDSDISQTEEAPSLPTMPAHGTENVFRPAWMASPLRDDQKPFVCAKCNKSFTRVSTLRRHRLAIHDPGVVWICQPRRGYQPLECWFCPSPVDLEGYCRHHRPGKCLFNQTKDRTFYRFDGFKAHLRTVHYVTQEELRSLDTTTFERQRTKEDRKASQDLLLITFPVYRNTDAVFTYQGRRLGT